jgi:hypothetical protein
MAGKGVRSQLVPIFLWGGGSSWRLGRLYHTCSVLYAWGRKVPSRGRRGPLSLCCLRASRRKHLHPEIEAGPPTVKQGSNSGEAKRAERPRGGELRELWGESQAGCNGPSGISLCPADGDLFSEDKGQA